MRISNPMGIFLSTQFAAIAASQDFIGFPYTFPVETPRNFTKLSAAGSMYYSLNETLTFNGAFTIELEFSTSNTSSNQYLFDSNVGSRTYCILNLAGGIDVPASITTIEIDGSTTFPDPRDGKLHKIKLTGSGTGSVNVLATKGTFSEFLDGVIADVKLLGGEINGVPTPVLYTTDEDWVSSTNLNNNATIGGLGDATAVNITAAESEPFDFIGGDWLGIELAAAATFDFTTTGIGEQVNQSGSGSLDIGQIYKVIADNATANTFNFVPFGGSYVSDIDAIDTAASTAVTWEGNQIGDYELSSISVKRILEVAP